MSDFKTEVDLAESVPFALGPLKVTPALLEVAIGERRETMEPRIMQVFVALNRTKGEVVSRDALIRDCWDGRAVGDDAINRCIARLRRLAQTEGGFAIETIPRVGYRLSETQPTTAAESVSEEQSFKSTPRGWSWRRIALGAALAGLLAGVVAGGIWLWLRPQPTLNRVAVLPFQVMSGKDANLFADSLAQQIIGVLNENQVQAVSRAQTAMLRGADRDQMAGRLGADFILDGSIQKISAAKPRLRVTVHLDHTSTHATLWTETFDQEGEDAISLQARVAAQVVDEIKAAIRSSVTQDDTAITAYLRAQKYARIGGLTATTLRRDQMRIVVEKAPNFSLGYSGLAVATAQLIHFSPQTESSKLTADAERAITKALELDPKNGEAYVAKSYLAGPWDFATQEDALRQGLKIEPDEPTLNSTLAAMLDDVGRINEALLFQQRAVMLDPLSPRKTAGLAVLQAISGNPVQAHDTIERAVKLWPGVWQIRLFIASSYGAPDQARQILNAKKASPSQIEPDILAALDSYQKAQENPRPEAVEYATRKILVAFDKRHIALDAVIELLIRLGNIDTVYDVMEKIQSSTTATKPTSRTDTAALLRPDAVAMRKDKRFLPLVTKLGLTAYWKAHGGPDFCAREAVAACAGLPTR